MTRRRLRIATIFIIVQSLLFFPAPVSRAQDGITQAEVISAWKVADLFMKRLDETGDFSSVIDEMYVEDFIERYWRQETHDGKESDSSVYLDFGAGISCKRSLLKLATAEDWKRLYVANNNFFYHVMALGLNKHADDLLNGRELDNETPEDWIPSKVIALLNKQPALKVSFALDTDTSGENQGEVAEETNGPKAIETLEEMQEVTETLQEAVRLLIEEQGNHPPRLTETAKSALELARLKLKDEEIEPSINVLDRNHMGLPVGTRLLTVLTPFMFCLDIAEVNGKQKIVWAHLYFPD